MTLIAETLAWLLAALLLVPLAVLVVECLAALLPPRRGAADPAALRPRWAVLVPAHDEEAVLGQTLADLVPQVGPGDRVLVVADNCTDRTAEVARAAGASVVERTSDKDRRGKDYALVHGLDQLEKDPPQVIIIVDADCRVPAGGVDRLAGEAAATGRPVQAIYLMDVPPGGGPTKQLSAFAFLVKNLVRPRGLDRLGLPCLLTGTGMAFPWRVLREALQATGNIVEDMKLGIDMALSGRPPKLCPDVTVTSVLPSGEEAARKQRARWVHGHLLTLKEQVPRLLKAGLRQRRPELLGLALELSVPPLGLLLMLWAAVALALTLWAWGPQPSAWPAVVLGTAGLGVLLGILAAWARFGRRLLPPAALLLAPFYVVAKASVYVSFLFRRTTTFVRTERDAATPAPRPTGVDAKEVPASPHDMK
jgi:cellulose synthase/poly-beta-1,6-N-acetylglucosamine synthase-like glycosyltransferase